MIILLEVIHCLFAFVVLVVIRQWFYSPLLGPNLFFSFIIFFPQTIGLLGQVISQSQGRYLYKGQQKHRINAHADIHAFEWDSNPRSQCSGG
jgi:ABC-type transport system involved in multi-copper enzyme maturation permease subunit